MPPCPHPFTWHNKVFEKMSVDLMFQLFQKKKIQTENCNAYQDFFEGLTNFTLKKGLAKTVATTYFITFVLLGAK